MRGTRGPTMSKEQAEKFFGRKADPDSYLSPKEFLKKKFMPRISKKTATKNKAKYEKVVGKVKSGVKNYAKNVVGGAKIVGGAVKKVLKKIPKPKRGGGRAAYRKAQLKKAKPGELFNAQRAKVEKAMNAAQKKGGSNGVGVGY